VPTYEYFCEGCNAVFEELLLMPDDVKKHSKEHPCPKCRESAKRLDISLTNFTFATPARQAPVQGSGVQGQSGSHDLDYPSLDKAIGRSAEKKWVEYDKRKKARDKIRKETGTNAISTAGGSPAPADKQVMKVRETGLKTWQKRPR
jgi:putative FmdB family regulatory protein